ncbi:hypothetical protein, partial [Pseudomonas palleroniana]|uniref:hypothetical protein n=1 Tax=Pseudomonas palleroniana TaxID=191390 RepID=UPI001BAF2716
MPKPILIWLTQRYREQARSHRVLRFFKSIFVDVWRYFLMGASFSGFISRYLSFIKLPLPIAQEMTHDNVAQHSPRGW